MGGAAPASSRARGRLPDLPRRGRRAEHVLRSGYELYVQGAERDNARLCEFLYRNLGTITAIIPTLDSHRATQIFHPVWLIDEEGTAPDPYTLITAEDARTAAGGSTPQRSRAQGSTRSTPSSNSWTTPGSSRRAASTR